MAQVQQILFQKAQDDFLAMQPKIAKVKEKLNKALDLLKGEGQMQTRANTLLALGIIPFKRSKISVLLETLV